jgi:hypothetical protein
MRLIGLGLAAHLALLTASPARAIVGGQPAGPEIAGHVAMIVHKEGMCSAVVVAPTLLLTAGHCARPAKALRLFDRDPKGQPLLLPVAEVITHPDYKPRGYDKRQRTVDFALVRLAVPVPTGYGPVPLPHQAEDGIVGARYRIAGFGVSVRGDGTTNGTLREATLVGVPPPSDVQLRLQDSERSAVGACQSDSGGLVMRVSGADHQPIPARVVGIIGSARGADDRGCGGFTGVALLGPALPWIRSTAARMGVALP